MHGGLVVQDGLKHRAICGLAGEADVRLVQIGAARLGRFVEHIVFPRDDDVAVVCEAGRVAIRQDELPRLAFEVCDVDDGFEEELVEDVVEAVWAAAAVDGGVWEGDVGFEVGRFEVLAVPALWEEEF